MGGGDRARRAVGALAGIVVAWVTVEIACYAFFSTFRERFPFYDIERLTLPREKLERAARVFDADLGWRRFFDTPHGERPRLQEYGSPLLATYGDSFTYGEQVGDGETYQAYLAKLFEKDVYNFGHGGWGTDQAYLYFRARGVEPETPLVSIGLITENVNRIVNVFRPFYHPRTALALAKPRFRLRDGELELLPNPVRSVDELENLTEVEFVRSLGEHDWWYNREDLPELTFPYSAILANRHLWREVLRSPDDHEGGVDARPGHDLWEVEEPRELMYAILERFHEEVRSAGATPLVILSPRKREIDHRLEGRETAAADHLMEHCRVRGYRCFDGVSAISDAVTERDDVRRFFDHHLTPLGNMVFAERLARWLIDEGLVSEPRPSSR